MLLILYYIILFIYLFIFVGVYIVVLKWDIDAVCNEVQTL